MDYIRLNKIIKHGNRVEYDYSVSDYLKQCFTDAPFFCDYPVNIEDVPDSILTIPFVSNLLPVVWLSNSKLIIDSLDSDFYICLNDVKNGYKKMYPNAKFRGKYEINRIVENHNKKGEKSCILYSGGLDAFNTLIDHLEENPDLITIWGADIWISNEDSWEKMFSPICETAKSFNLNNYYIKSSFREIGIDWKFEVLIGEKVNDLWWHGLQHGIGMLGLVAPLAWVNNYKNAYIASSHCPADEPVTCASHPTIDNHVRFCGCSAVHDGYFLNRQDKMHNVVHFCRENHIDQELHVCWEKNTGKNCCACEKCYRTIASIMAENDDPKKFGFYDYERYISAMQTVVKKSVFLEDGKDGLPKHHWVFIQKKVREYIDKPEDNQYWQYLSWILDLDLSESNSNTKTKKNNTSELKKKIRNYREHIRFMRSLSLNKRDIILVGTPNYPNIGDSAIAMAELMFLRDCGIGQKHIKEISCYDYKNHKKLIQHAIRKKRNVICLIGGGNMGDQWTDEESFRQDIISTYTENPIIVFPQTIFFSKTPEDQQKEFVSVYNLHRQLTVIARETKSFEIMNALLKQPAVLLSPDIVLWLTADKLDLPKADRNGVLFVFRSDPEQEMVDEDRERIKVSVQKRNISVRTTDTVLPEGEVIIKENRDAKVMDKLSEFASAKLVITDRLHGMIFSAITGTPCIALDNYNHKVQGTYEWIEYLPYIRFAKSSDEAISLIPEMLDFGDCEYDNSKLQSSYERIKIAVQSQYRG